MGSGKSTLLEKFAVNSSSYKYFDLDSEIHKLHGVGFSSLGEFIESKGWDHFRRVETEIMEDFLNKDESLVLSLGGGAVSGVNLSKIKKSEDAKLVYLDVPFEVCFERISGDSNRPLVKLGKEKLQNMYNERLPLYKCAEIQLTVGQIEKLESPEQLQEC